MNQSSGYSDPDKYSITVNLLMLCIPLIIYLTIRIQAPYFAVRKTFGIFYRIAKSGSYFKIPWIYTLAKDSKNEVFCLLKDDNKLMLKDYVIDVKNKNLNMTFKIKVDIEVIFSIQNENLFLSCLFGNPGFFNLLKRILYLEREQKPDIRLKLMLEEVVKSSISDLKMNIFSFNEKMIEKSVSDSICGISLKKLCFISPRGELEMDQLITFKKWLEEQ